MSGTSRNHHLEIPLYTRMSDLKEDCWWRWFLNHVHEDRIEDATYFLLGNVIHHAFEHHAQHGTMQAELIEFAVAELDAELAANTTGWRETKARPLDRDLLAGHATEAIVRFFDEVHPDGEHRMDVYKAYDWPFTTEQIFYVQPKSDDIFKYPVRSEVDAIFHPLKGRVKRIVDWKSGTSSRQPEIQLWGYHWGLNRDPNIDYNQYSFAGHFHHMLVNKGGGKLQEVMNYPGDRSIERAIATVEYEKEKGRVVPEIAFPFSPSYLCKVCPHQAICPEFEGGLVADTIVDILKNEPIEWLTEPIDKKELVT